MRRGDWKFVVNSKRAWSELLNLAEDLSAKPDLSAAKTEKAAELRARYFRLVGRLFGRGASWLSRELNHFTQISARYSCARSEKWPSFGSGQNAFI